jgi:hypothetical protein
MKTPTKYRVIEQLRKLYPENSKDPTNRWKFVFDGKDDLYIWENKAQGKVIFNWVKTAFDDVDVREYTYMDKNHYWNRNVPIVFEYEVE